MEAVDPNDPRWQEYSVVADKIKTAVAEVTDGLNLAVVLAALVPVIAFMLLHVTEAQRDEETERLLDAVRQVVARGTEMLPPESGRLN